MSTDGCVAGARATPEDVLAGRARWCVVEGDALDVVPALPAACIDAIVTDPPAGIAFMGAEWDRDKGGRAQWCAWLASILGHARAATKDGGRALVWSLPRTSHWTGCAVEDAGWAIENTVTHLFGTGWPKGKSQLKPLAETWWLARTGRSAALNIEGCRVKSGASPSIERRETAARTGNTPAGKTSAGGWGRRNTAEHYTAKREGESAGRYPPNVVLSHAPGCRCVGERRVECNNRPRNNSYSNAIYSPGKPRKPRVVELKFGDPDGTERVEAWECAEGCPVAELDAQAGDRPGLRAGPMLRRGAASGAGLGYGSTSTTQTVSAGHDEGGEVSASRFFPQFPADEYALFGYHAKPSRAERDAGVSLDAASVNRYGAMGQGPMPQQTPRVASAQGNNHPTVKSIALMRWLVRLVTRPGDVVLDPFGGSGTTGVAAVAEGRRVILVERDPRYAEIARQRCAHATPDLGTPVRVPARAGTSAPAADTRQRSLLDLLAEGTR